MADLVSRCPRKGMGEVLEEGMSARMGIGIALGLQKQTSDWRVGLERTDRGGKDPEVGCQGEGTQAAGGQGLRRLPVPGASPSCMGTRACVSQGEVHVPAWLQRDTNGSDWNVGGVLGSALGIQPGWEEAGRGAGRRGSAEGWVPCSCLVGAQ